MDLNLFIHSHKDPDSYITESERITLNESPSYSLILPIV